MRGVRGRNESIAPLTHSKVMSGNQFFHLSANGRFGAIGNNLGVLKLVKRNAVLLSPRTIFVGNGAMMRSLWEAWLMLNLNWWAFR